jgi:hypothetical protein
MSNPGRGLRCERLGDLTRFADEVARHFKLGEA